jgi:hypothetical protein
MRRSDEMARRNQRCRQSLAVQFKMGSPNKSMPQGAGPDFELDFGFYGWLSVPTLCSAAPRLAI